MAFQTKSVKFQGNGGGGSDREDIGREGVGGDFIKSIYICEILN